MSILNLFNLEGEVAVVTGAGKGIGKGIALALAEAGADVVVASRSEDQLNDVAKEIKAYKCYRNRINGKSWKKNDR